MFAFPLAAFACAAALLYIGRRLALKTGYADKPGGRKKHEMPVPPIGGLVILPIFILFAFLSGTDSIAPWPLLAGMAVLLLMGGIDDVRPVNSVMKFTVMIGVCCFVVIFGQGQIVELGNLLGTGNLTLPIGWAAEAFTVLAIVLLMNAINMVDGVDGLAGGFCALVTFCLILLCAGAGLTDGVEILGILLAVLAAFLMFNLRGPWRKRASIFMGDAGALCLGLVIGWMCIRLTQPPASLISPAAVIWLIALPVWDAFGLFIVRSLRGLHPFTPDRRHLHHRFIDAGMSPILTTYLMLALYALTASVGFVGIMLHVPPYILYYLWLGGFALHAVLIGHPRGYTLMTRYLRTKWRKTAH